MCLLGCRTGPKRRQQDKVREVFIMQTKYQQKTLTRRKDEIKLETENPSYEEKTAKSQTTKTVLLEKTTVQSNNRESLTEEVRKRVIQVKIIQKGKVQQRGSRANRGPGRSRGLAGARQAGKARNSPTTPAVEQGA